MSNNDDIHWARTDWNVVDQQELLKEYPSPDEYDFSNIHLRSETRELARDFYEDNTRIVTSKVNEYAAAFAQQLLSPLIEDGIEITTTQHNEKVIIVNKQTASRNPTEVGSFTQQFRKRLYAADGKRHFCNIFRDTMISTVSKTITEVHKILAGFGVPPLPASSINAVHD